MKNHTKSKILNIRLKNLEDQNNTLKQLMSPIQDHK